ncbi:MAG: transporter permease, partial [Paenibacillaceae bacterium]|nr:transporter permease [Paenibacillaceae bacterium]
MVKNRLRSLPLYLVLALCAFTTVFPILNVLAMSFSSSRAIVSGEVVLWPVEFNSMAYLKLFQDGQLLYAMRNTVVITVLGTLLQMTATTLAAFSLSKQRLKGRTVLTFAVLFSMMFGTGLIPL